MRWYDYPICIVAADFISTGLVYGLPLGVIIGLTMYLMYETIRRLI